MAALEIGRRGHVPNGAEGQGRYVTRLLPVLLFLLCSSAPPLLCTNKGWSRWSIANAFNPFTTCGPSHGGYTLNHQAAWVGEKLFGNSPLGG